MTLRPAPILAALLLGATVAPAAAVTPGTNGMIAYERPQHDGQPPSDLHMIAPDGVGGEQTIFSTRNFHEGEGTFSTIAPNIVAFFRFSRTLPGAIFLGDLTTGLTVRLTSAKDFADAPSFSPDGSKIAFFTDRDFPPPKSGFFPGCCPAEIYVIGVDGTGLRRVTNDHVDSSDPDWSPDGTQIVYMESRMVGTESFQSRLAVINADGTGRHAITRYGGPDEINGKWGPDGRIVFERLRARDSDIMVMNADGTQATPILATSAWETNPVPSPDGTKIVFTSDRHHEARDRINRYFEVYTMNSDGTGITRLTTNNRLDAFPDWQRLP